jgi:hypothetical protein
MGLFDTVEEDGGIVVHQYDQTDGAVMELAAQERGSMASKGVGKEFQKDKSVADGVCRALCTHWVANSANGQDYWSTLEPGKSEKKKEVLADIRLLQHREGQYHKSLEAALGVSPEERRVMSQSRFDRKVSRLDSGLQLALMKSDEARREWAPKRVIEKTGMEEIQTDPPRNATDLAEMCTKVQGYSLLGFDHKDGGHEVATYNDPNGGVFFMDPNFGEVYFEKPAQFVTWFTTKYAQAYGGIKDSGLEIDCFRNAQQPRRPEYARPRPGVILPANQTASQNILLDKFLSTSPPKPLPHRPLGDRQATVPTRPKPLPHRPLGDG